MLSISRDGGPLRIAGPSYALAFRADRPYAVLDDRDGVRWAELCLLASAHTTGGLDDSAVIEPPSVEVNDGGARVVIEATSSRWARRRLVVDCLDDRFSVHAELAGSGALTDVHLLGGFTSASPRWGSGFHASAAYFASLVSPEPSDPWRAAVPASVPAAIDVVGSSLPGRGHWFFTPPPYCFAVSRASPPGDATDAVEELPLPAGPWMTLGIVAESGEWNFSGLHYEPGERIFSLRLAYEGQTRVEGVYPTPAVTFGFGAADPYEAFARYGELVPRREASRATSPGWWRRPIFCGWGEQCHLAGRAGHAPDFSRQELYDRFLGVLEEHGLRPGTIVLDDKWQEAYGTCRVDRGKWPDLPGWIEARHQAGQRVLLWWKAWDPEGVPAEHCVRNAAGLPVAPDPTNPGYLELLRESVTRMLSPGGHGLDGYDADGLKIDFTGNTPSGPLSRVGSAWGTELLRELLTTLRDAARAVKPDALLMTHTPNPYLAHLVDMIRLNDIMRLDDAWTDAPYVAHMRHRAAIVRAVLPDVLIDTDNWALPDLATWRRYVRAQTDLGVPSLYYATHVDRSGEALTDDDYALLRDVWGRPSDR